MKKVRCISLEENRLNFWANRFEVGKTYVCKYSDFGGLLLETNGGVTYWVDPECFEEVCDE